MKKSHYMTLVALSVLSACSGPEGSKVESDLKEAETFGPEERQVARRLSIGSQNLDSNSSVQYQAALCSLALSSIQTRLREGGLLSAEEQRAFAQAQSLYRQRAAVGISDEQREKILTDIKVAYPNQSDLARFAIGCLRDLT